MRTPGPYLRQDRTIYALESIGYRKGVEQFQNRIYAGFQGGPNTPKEEVEATAAFFQMAANCHDDLVAALEAIKGLINFNGMAEYSELLRALGDAYSIADKALAKAKEAQP